MDFVSFVEQNWFAIGGLIGIIGCTWKMSTQLHDFKKNIEERDNKLDQKLDDMKEEINNKVKSLEEKVSSQENRHKDDMERTRLIMDGVEATLVSLHNDGHNGPVTKSLEAINEYKSQKAVE